MKTPKVFTVNISERLAKIVVLLPLSSYFGYHLWTLIQNVRSSPSGLLDGTNSVQISLLENTLLYLAYDLFLLVLFYIYFLKQPRVKRLLLTAIGFVMIKFTATLYEIFWVTFFLHNTMYGNNTENYMIGSIDSRIILMRLSVIGITGIALYLYRKSAKNF